MNLDIFTASCPSVLVPHAFFKIGRMTSLSCSSTSSWALVALTSSISILRLCVCFLTSASWSDLKSMRPMLSAWITFWTSCTVRPGVALSANVRNLTPRSHSIRMHPTYEWLPLALCASSMTTQTTSFAGQTLELMSFSIVCGVQKKTRLERQCTRRVPLSSFFVLPIIVHVSSVGMPHMLLHAAFC